jgi:branched-chain amino acid transport system permease protein
MTSKLKNLSFFKKSLLTVVLILVSYGITFALMQTKVIDRYWTGILVNVCINIILVVSLNITCGFLGQLTLGHAGFMAVGAYAAAFVSKTLTGLPIGISFFIALLIGGIASMIIGAVVCYPTLRLKGDYLAIITLAFGEVIKNVLTNLKVIGGAKGYYGIPVLTNFSWAFAWAVIMVIVAYFLFQSRQGRAILSIREDEIAAEASGVNTNKYKLLAFVIAAFFAGIAGGLYAHNMGILEPKVFKLDKSIEILVMVVLGGMGSIKGSIIGATALTILPELLRSVSEYRMLLYSVVLILVMLYRYDVRLIPMRKKFTDLFKNKKQKEVR